MNVFFNSKHKFITFYNTCKVRDKKCINEVPTRQTNIAITNADKIQNTLHRYEIVNFSYQPYFVLTRKHSYLYIYRYHFHTYLKSKKNCSFRVVY